METFSNSLDRLRRLMKSKDQDIYRSVRETLTGVVSAHDGRVVPSTEALSLDGPGKRLEATVLYADLYDSSSLVESLDDRTVAKAIRAYLSAMCQIIRINRGVVTSFDGDRVMGVFLDNYPTLGNGAMRAINCGLHMVNVVESTLQPQFTEYLMKRKKDNFVMRHCVGIDSSNIFIVRAGQYGQNDRVWIGRASNLAAKLSQIRNHPYCIYVSRAALGASGELANFTAPFSINSIWETCLIEHGGKKMQIYGADCFGALCYADYSPATRSLRL